jgi:1-deoxyxylulose-5-phosphate synthase
VPASRGTDRFSHAGKPVRVALAWLPGKLAVTAPIMGATSVAHLVGTATAAGVRLTGEEVARLEAAYRPHLVLGHC